MMHNFSFLILTFKFQGDTHAKLLLRKNSETNASFLDTFGHIVPLADRPIIFSEAFRFFNLPREPYR